MYCNNCGSKIEEHSKFCANCGVQVGGSVDFVENPKQVTYQPQPSSQYFGTQPYYPPSTPHREKEPAIALILSLVVMIGSGHIYAGKIGKGIGLIFGALGCAVLIYSGVFAVGFIYNFGLFMALMLIGSICAIALAIYAHVDAYKTAKNYNRFLHTHGRPPTSNDNW